jgi:signal transduction histidine kinase
MLSRNADAAEALTIAAHDLRAPLANIALLLDGIGLHNERGATDRVAQTADAAHSIIESMNDLLGGLLQRIKQSGDPFSFKPGRVDLRSILQRAAAQNAALASERAVSIECRCRGPVHAPGDAQLLFQAVDNLLTNALKYTGTGTSVICESASDKGFGAVRIWDEGPGLDGNKLASCFQPFIKLGSRNGSSAPSSGLGLWLVRLIATRHGGTVSANPKPNGAGSVFELRIPLAGPGHPAASNRLGADCSPIQPED